MKHMAGYAQKVIGYMNKGYKLVHHKGNEEAHLFLDDGGKTGAITVSRLVVQYMMENELVVPKRQGTDTYYNL